MSHLGRTVFICFLLILLIAYGDAVWEYLASP